MEELKRRDLTGIYIFDTFPGEKHRRPTCIEDCRPSTRRGWALSKSRDYLRETIAAVAKTFDELTDYCLAENCINDEMAKEFHKMMERAVDRSKCNWAEHELADQLDSVCSKVRLLADAVGVTKHQPDEDDEED